MKPLYKRPKRKEMQFVKKHKEIITAQKESLSGSSIDLPTIKVRLNKAKSAKFNQTQRTKYEQKEKIAEKTQPDLFLNKQIKRKEC